MPAVVKCPTCKRDVEWTAAFPYRPFCSDRCRLIDLGAWLTEQHKIAEETPGPQQDVTQSSSVEE